MNGNIQSVSAQEARQLIGVEALFETGPLTNGSMTLLTVTEDIAGFPTITINGETLMPADVIIVGRVIKASPSLNVRYGGSGEDGLGFSDRDTISVRYNRR